MLGGIMRPIPAGDHSVLSGGWAAGRHTGQGPRAVQAQDRLGVNLLAVVARGGSSELSDSR